ncbi:MAG: RNA-binding protein [Deltaproteobacteria bacterium]|nr:MAG: RNA-binding protein [Deltaproteobacteria bacterium]
MKSFLDFEEKNVEKAVQKACAELNVSRDKLKYDIISHGSSGIFGLVGTKKALIRVFVPDLPKGKSFSDASVIAGHGNKNLNSDTAQSEKDTISALVDEAFGEVKNVAGSVEKAKKTKKTKKNNKIVKPEKAKKPEKPQSLGKNEPVEKSKPPLATTEDPSINNEAAICAAQDLVHEIFRAMSIEAEMSVSVNSESDQCWVNVKVSEPGILIGKRGQTLEAIQYLVDKVVNKQCGKGTRVIFDVEGYVESRKSELKELASRMASKAVKTGKPSTMTRMNAHDRRIVHVSLKGNRSVRTQSIGDGYYRKLIIFPKKKSQKKAGKAQPKA